MAIIYLKRSPCATQNCALPLMDFSLNPATVDRHLQEILLQA